MINASQQSSRQEKLRQAHGQEKPPRAKGGKKERARQHRRSEISLQTWNGCIAIDQKVPEINRAAHPKGPIPAQG